MTPEQEKLVTDNLRLVTYCCRPYAGKHYYEDLKGEAKLALVKAAVGYNSKKGKFSTYACTAIQRAIWRFQIKQTGMTLGEATRYKETGLVFRPKQKRAKKIRSVLDPLSFKKGRFHYERI